MPFYDCPGCGAVFHRPTEEPFAWCACGEPVDSDALLPHLPEPRPRRVEILNRGGTASPFAIAESPAAALQADRHRPLMVKRKRRPA